MSLSLSSRRERGGSDLLARAATEAKALGFAEVFAARPPKDPTRTRPVVERLGLGVSAVGTDPVDAWERVGASIDHAAEAAAALRRPLVVLDAGGYGRERGVAPEASVERLSRAVHASLSRWPGLSVAVAPAAGSAGLLDVVATAWLLEDLPRATTGLWLDVVRAAAVGPGVLPWADRFARRILGVALHGAEGGRPHGLPVEDGALWRTLRGLLPSGAPRVLDVGPDVPAPDVVDARRRFEERDGW